MRVATAKCRAREFLRGCAVGFGEQRPNVLRLVLPLKPVYEILWRKLVGGITFFAKQIAYGVVVLAVRKPAQHGCGFRCSNL